MFVNSYLQVEVDEYVSSTNNENIPVIGNKKKGKNKCKAELTKSSVKLPLTLAIEMLSVLLDSFNFTDIQQVCFEFIYLYFINIKLICRFKIQIHEQNSLISACIFNASKLITQTFITSKSLSSFEVSQFSKLLLIWITYTAYYFPKFEENKADDDLISKEFEKILEFTSVTLPMNKQRFLPMLQSMLFVLSDLLITLKDSDSLKNEIYSMTACLFESLLYLLQSSTGIILF